MAEKFTVTGEQDLSIDKQMSEIKRQIRQKGGSPLNPELVAFALQDIIEGKFKSNESVTVKLVGNHEIDTDRIPNSIFDHLKIKKHQGCGKIMLDFSKISFYLSEKQKTGTTSFDNLSKELEGKKVMNECVLTYLFRNPHLIPEDWKKDSEGKARHIFFWGTVFQDSGCLFVPYLYFDGFRWNALARWNQDRFDVNDPAVVFEI